MGAPTDHILLEVCVSTIAGALAAVAGGADRLELNAALALGGLTPSVGLVRGVRDLVPPHIELVCMLRPRPGDFNYSHYDLSIMRADLAALVDAGADGIALGVLTASREIDMDACRALVRQIGDQPCRSGHAVQAVFHRAFDFAADPHASLAQLIELGFHRVLTSGQRPTASEGAELIADMLQHADGRIEILPGSGVRPDNVIALLEQTGASQVHGSFRAAAGHVDRWQQAGLGTREETCEQTVRAVRRRLDSWSSRR